MKEPETPPPPAPRPKVSPPPLPQVFGPLVLACAPPIPSAHVMLQYQGFKRNWSFGSGASGESLLNFIQEIDDEDPFLQSITLEQLCTYVIKGT